MWWTAALVWSTERVFYVALSGESSDLPDLTTAVEAMCRIWTTTIYGTSERP
jgi:hypothetical protein